jgi:hypothetical protein
MRPTCIRSPIAAPLSACLVCVVAWQFSWAVGWGGFGREVVSAIAWDGVKGILVAGNFTSPTVTIGSTTLTNSAQGTSDMFLASLDSATGTLFSADQYGGAMNDSINAMSVYTSAGVSSVHLAGYFRSPSVEIGSAVVQNIHGSGNGMDAFAARVLMSPVTSSPTRAPTAVTSRPTRVPSARPSRVPSSVPTRQPTLEPTQLPSWAPTGHPTPHPTQEPTQLPSGVGYVEIVRGVHVVLNLSASVYMACGSGVLIG